MMDMEIRGVRGMRIWDSRGRPTVEVAVTLAGGAMGLSLIHISEPTRPY